VNDPLFNHPPAGYRIVPFWFWNGQLDASELVRQVEEMADKGVGGFFICARQGLEIPYLSKAWFERVEVVVEAAAAHGLSVWLYDEYPYPSGVAGGEVTLQHPDAKHTLLKVQEHTVKGPQAVRLELPWARVLTAKAVPIAEGGRLLWAEAVDLRDHIGSWQAENIFQKTGLTAYNQKRFFTYRPTKVLSWSAPHGNWHITALLEEEVSDFKYYGTFVDPCHEGAVETFIQLTHQRYADAVGEHFGGTIKGFFTDEIDFLGALPWSPQLEPFFREHWGYSLIEQLPELLYAGSPKAARVRYNYFQALHLLLRETYHRRVRAWCDAHGLTYVAEVPAARMATVRYSGVPGGDAAHEKVGRSLQWLLDEYALSLRNNPKMVSSLARQLGTTRALIECFHSVGWSMTLQDAKWMLDRLAALGINLFNFHAFFYTLDGLAKYDAPPSQFFQNPYWPHFRQLADYAARLGYALSQGVAVVRIAMLDPVSSLWTHLGNPFHAFRYGGRDEAEARRLEQLKGDWAYLGKTLLTHHLDFDHLDPELLSEAEVQGEHLKLGDASYTVLILPPMTNLEAAAWSKVRQFLQAGGTVIALGLLPHEVIDENERIEDEALEVFGLDASPRDAYWHGAPSQDQTTRPSRGQQRAYFITSSGSLTQAGAGNALCDLLNRLAPPRFRLEPKDDRENSFLLQHRALPDSRQLLFVTHQGADERDVRLSAALDAAPWHVEALDLESGEVGALATEKTATGFSVTLSFAPYQARLLRFRRAETPAEAMVKATVEATVGGPLGARPERPWTLKLEPDDRWSLTALQANVLRLSSFDLALEPGLQGDHEDRQAEPHPPSHPTWHRVTAKTLIDQCADLGERLPLAFHQTFGTPVRTGLAYPLTCWYRREFYVDEVPADGALMMDRSAISGDFALYLNGKRLSRTDFEPHAHYDRCNRRCEVAPLLVQGVNTLLLRVEAQRDWDGLVEPLYVTGNFGVYLHGQGAPRIGRVPERAKFGAGSFEGYPYFAGTLSLKRTFDLGCPPDQKTFEVDLPLWSATYHECAEVLVNGHSLGVRCWSPYRFGGSTELLVMGNNLIEFRLTNTLVGMLEGSYFDYETHRVVPYDATT
jgi:hypothetical protein